MRFPLRLRPALILLMAAARCELASGQVISYDSRETHAPHYFDWDDRFGMVDIRDDSRCQIVGGFISRLTLHDTAAGILYDGVIPTISARGASSLVVFNADTGHLDAWDGATLDVFGVQNREGISVNARGLGMVRLHGGGFGLASTGGAGGHIEVHPGAAVSILSASEAGIVSQFGGGVGSMQCRSTGVVVIDGGSVTETIASQDGVLVLAGGWPAMQMLRLYDRARVLVFHGGLVIKGQSYAEKLRTLRLADLDEPAGHENLTGLRTFLTLDGLGVEITFTAFAMPGAESRWAGSIELIRLDDELHLEAMPDSKTMLLAFRVAGSEVVQIEVSPDLVEWHPYGQAVIGTDWHVHTRAGRLDPMGGDRYFRLRRHLK